jgi:Ala-tRNA(Pro) deacylase
MNNENAYVQIRRQLDEQGVSYGVIEHEAVRTSQESAKVRAAGGWPNARGAKALIVKCEAKKGNSFYATLVVPSQYRIDTRTVRTSIGGIRKFRFLTAEEMLAVVQLTPGCMPPFGPTIFEAVAALYVDPRIKEYPEVGFNAARLETSLVVPCADYLRVARPTAIIPLTTGELCDSGGSHDDN